jgi:hypothetical protein
MTSPLLLLSSSKRDFEAAGENIQPDFGCWRIVRFLTARNQNKRVTSCGLCSKVNESESGSISDKWKSE